ncbi:mesogenin-1 [Esox lucius]|uniref:mesogenin-1 n=1 Tax=Esox lucius TaxID=8010 RepID=UPI000577DFB9|nr:mesogenin-1 [Esox lucius]
MENLSEDIVDLDCEIDIVTSKMLSEWDWKTQERAFGNSHESLESTSPESSFDSMCSSPEMSSSSVGHQSFGHFSYALPGHSPTHCATIKQNKPKMSTKRRMKASEREKMRMRSLAEALHQLRDYLPPDYSKRGQPLTKIQTLKYTIEYINELSDILNQA